jgi:hypothetical protein
LSISFKKKEWRDAGSLNLPDLANLTDLTDPRRIVQDESGSPVFAHFDQDIVGERRKRDLGW